MRYEVVLTTTNSLKEAKALSKDIVKKKLAACANIIPNIFSIYEWKDNICEDEEFLIIFKTKEELVEDLKNFIKENHSYEVPEIISFEIKKADKDYLEWIDRVL